jgi:rhamnosyl/mannosyltransferase
VRKVPSAGEVLSVPTSPTFPLALREESRDVDVLHVHLPHPLGVGSQLAVGRRDPAVVVTYHSDIVRQRAALRFYRPIQQRFLGRADRILPTSPRLLEHSAQLGPHAGRCTPVPLSIDVSAFRDRIGNPPDVDLSTDPDRPTLLFVGRLAYYKGVEYLLDAMVAVEADLLVVGDGERREALERRARQRGVEGKVSFLGRVSDETLAGCYAAADVFVLPSVEPSEAFGVVQLEAMATGIPVVNTDLPTGVPWVSPDGETGYTVPPRDAGALADALADLLDDPERRERFGETARARVEARFDRERMIDRVEAVYEDVLDG